MLGRCNEKVRDHWEVSVSTCLAHPVPNDFIGAYHSVLYNEIMHQKTDRLIQFSYFY